MKTKVVLAAGVACLLAVGTFLLILRPSFGAPVSFNDVPVNHPYHDAILGMADAAIISGFEDGSFGPEKLVIRQQFAKMIVLTLGLPVKEADFPDPAVPFADLPDDDPLKLYPHEYIAVCARSNITSGKTTGTFDPYSNITRQQMITMVVRAADNLAPGTLAEAPAGWSGHLGYGDPTHGANIQKAEYNGLLDRIRADPGTQGLAGWSTAANATRGEVAQVLWNLLALLRPPLASGDLLHFWWEWDGPWKNQHAENVSDIAGGPEVAGAVYRVRRAQGSTDNHIVATGVNGHLVVYRVEDGNHDWKMLDITTQTGSAVAPGTLMGPVLETLTPGAATIHLMAVDPAGDLLHFSWPGSGTWKCANITALSGFKVAALCEYGLERRDSSGLKLHLAARGPDDHLLHFVRSADGSWLTRDLSLEFGVLVKGTPTVLVDTTEPDAGVAIAAATSSNQLVLFHEKEGGSWDFENVTVAAGVDFGGFIRTTRDDCLIRGRFLILDTSGRLLLLERESTPSAWSVTDISAAVGKQFSSRGAATIMFMPEFPTVPQDEVHFVGIDQTKHLIEIWTGADGGWMTEDLSETISHEVFSLLNWWSTSSGSPSVHYRRHLVAVAPDGDVLVIWGDPAKRDWRVYNASDTLGFGVQQQAATWVGSLGNDNHLIAIERR